MMAWQRGLVWAGCILLVGAASLALGSGVAKTMSKGSITGMSQRGCAPCHGVNASPGVKIAINGPAKVGPGETHEYTVTPSGVAGSGGGLNLSASQGSLSPGANTQLTNGEITHKGKESRSWSFSWTAPAQPGQYALRAAVNASNNDGLPSGDAWNLVSQEILVEAPTMPVPSVVAANPGSEVAKPVAPPPALPSLALKVPQQAAQGGPGVITASLRDEKDRPISGAIVRFYVEENFFLGLGNVPVETARGPMVVDYGAVEGSVKGLIEVGQARTGADGVAAFKYAPALSGDLKIVAKYEANSQIVAQATAVWQGAQHSVHYHPDIGIRVSFLKPSWILGILLGGIWFTFLYVLYQVLAISREKAGRE